ncbi:hypothetical protein FBU30_009851 [Linnemannia zychae]|nr:hypothetical protein FBU30_009851 [Linnemannia zychae]
MFSHDSSLVLEDYINPEQILPSMSSTHPSLEFDQLLANSFDMNTISTPDDYINSNTLVPATTLMVPQDQDVYNRNIFFHSVRHSMKTEIDIPITGAQTQNKDKSTFSLHYFPSVISDGNSDQDDFNAYICDFGDNENFDLDLNHLILKSDVSAVPVVPSVASYLMNATNTNIDTSAYSSEVIEFNLDCKNESNEAIITYDPLCAISLASVPTVPIAPPAPPLNKPAKRQRAKKGEKRIHACHICLREFTRACNMQSHILTHSGDKPHSCSQCDQKFVRIYDKKRHMRIHNSDDGPYKCEMCPLRFKRTEPRNRHQQVVHNWNPPHRKSRK